MARGYFSAKGARTGVRSGISFEVGFPRVGVGAVPGEERRRIARVGVIRPKSRLWLDVAPEGTILRPMENTAKTAVLYNASCPVCSAEIGHYARYASQNALPIRFDDLNSEALGAWGLDADMAARRLYVLHEGKLSSGIEAFLVLWAQMPRYRWLGRLVGLPWVRPIASATYDHLLAPLIYRWHLRRMRKRAAELRA